MTLVTCFLWGTGHETAKEQHMTPLLIENTKVADALVVSLIGTADMGQVDLLDRQLTQLCAQHPPRVIFDLSRLTFLASISIGALMRFHNSCKHWKGQMILAGSDDNVLGSLKRARLDKVFFMASSVENALGEVTDQKPV
jgi:anti-sigma B factor antagonist